MSGDTRDITVRIRSETEGVDKISALVQEIDKLSAEGGEAAPKFQALAGELRSIAGQQSLVERFSALKRETQEASVAADQAQSKVASLAREMRSAETPTRALAADFEKAKSAARLARTEFEIKDRTLIALRADLNAAGISTKALAEADRTLRTEVQSVEERLAALKTEYAEVGSAARAGAQAQSGANKAAASSIDEIGISLRGVAGAIGAVAGINIGTNLIRDAVETADAYNNLAARIRLVTGEGKAFDAAWQGVHEVALATNSSLESTGELFARVATAGKQFGVSSSDALKLVQTINQAVQLSGASAQASDAALTQLIQGLQAGVLRGDEFNSVMEQSPRLAQALADGLHVTVGELRALAQQGALSSRTVLEALKGQSATIAAEFEKLPPTLGRAVTNLQTQWMSFVGSLNNSTGATATIAEGINALANNLESIAGVASRAGAVIVAVLAVQAAGALRAYTIEALAAAAATNLLSTSISKVPRTVSIGVAVTGFEVGWQLGTMLQENFSWARKAGVAITGFYAQLINGLGLLKDAATAVLSGGDLKRAWDDYNARTQETRKLLGEMWDDAEKAPAKAASATDGAAKSLQDVGKNAQEAGGQAQQALQSAAQAAGGLAEKAATADGVLLGIAQKLGAILPTVRNVDEAAAALARMSAEGSKAAAAVRDELIAAVSKLSGEELLKFQRAAIAAFGDAGAAAANLAPVLDAIGERAITALGGDLTKATKGVSSEFAAAEAELQVFASSIDSLRAKGINTGVALEQMLTTAIEKAKSPEELERLAELVGTIGKQAGLAQKDAERLLDTIREKADAATPGINSLAEAFKTLGMQSRADLQKTAKAYQEAFTLIRNSGATLQEQRQAFQKYAEAAITANGGVATSTIQAQAAMYGLQLKTDSAGKAIVSSLGEGAKTADKLRGSLGDAADESDRLNSSLKDRPEFNPDWRNPLSASRNQELDAGLTADERAAGLVKRDVSTSTIDYRQVGLDAGLRGDALDRFVDRFGTELEGSLADFRARMKQLGAGGGGTVEATTYTREYGGAVEGAKSRALAYANQKPADSGKDDGGASTTNQSSVRQNAFGLQPGRAVQIDLNVGGRTTTVYAEEGAEDALIAALQAAQRRS